MSFLKLFDKPKLVGAHRGARAIKPENTLSALKASVGHYDFIEIDVQLSSDGVIIIMHDDTLERTTNVKEMSKFKSKKSYRVCDFTYKELLTLDYGSWFSSYEPLLTLSNTLKFIKENELYLNIEIKDIHENFSDEEIVSKVTKEIQKYNVESLVMISSFRHKYLVLCKKKLPNVPTAALVEDEHPPKLLEYLKEIKVDAYHLNKELVDEKTVKDLKEADFFVNVYAVYEPIKPNEAKKLFEMGVDGVFSDFFV